MRLLSALSMLLLFFSCSQTPVQIEIEKYCECAEKISKMDGYDYDRLGKYWQERADSLHLLIDSIHATTKPDIDDLGRVSECATIMAKASYQRLKEFDQKHGLD